MAAPDRCLLIGGWSLVPASTEIAKSAFASDPHGTKERRCVRGEP